MLRVRIDKGTKIKIGIKLVTVWIELNPETMLRKCQILGTDILSLSFMSIDNNQLRLKKNKNKNKISTSLCLPSGESLPAFCESFFMGRHKLKSNGPDLQFLWVAGSSTKVHSRVHTQCNFQYILSVRHIYIQYTSLSITTTPETPICHFFRE